MASLSELFRGDSRVARLGHPDKIRLFAWHLHRHAGADRFTAADIRACYEELHLDQPANVNSYLARMLQTSPKQALRDERGYYLERRIRDRLDDQFGHLGERTATVEVTRLLSELPDTVPSLAEKAFLAEALICFRAGAFRASIVMCWNLAFDHLCEFILASHLGTFNRQWPVRFSKLHAKARITEVRAMDDFSELKESEIIDICRSGAIISGDVAKILSQKLERRNTAAHPSNVIVTQLQAEEFISDLVSNVVMKLR